MKFPVQNSASLGYLLAAALIVALALLAVSVVLIWKARRKEEKKAEEWEATEQLSGVPGMTESFRAALRRLKQRVPTWSYRYSSPWFVLVGETGSGKSCIADQISGLTAEAIRTEESALAPRWLLLDKAVLIDLPGRSFHSSESAAGIQVPHPQKEEASAQVAWVSFLRHTVRFRPRQPLNGIVLTLPANELLKAVSDPDHQRRMARITGIAQRMDEVQQVTGLSLPIYVLVTKCDVLPGFNTFSRVLFARGLQNCAEQPMETEIQDDLFGWSNPSALEKEYTPSWVEEAFDSVRGALLRYQLEMLSQSHTAAEADHLFLFPFQLQQLQQPLQVLLNVVFRSTAFRESHRLRGIYFCGQVRETSEKPRESNVPQLAAGAALRLPESAPGPLCFVRNLFEYKIFAERFLASPVTRFFSMGNRSLFAARLAACLLLLLLGGGAVHAWIRISALQQHTMVPVLDVLAQSLDSISLTSSADMKPAADLLNTLGASRESEYYSLAMPYSYLDFDGLHRDLHGTLERTFEFVILRSCKNALEARIAAVMNEGPRLAAAPTTQASAHAAGDSWSIDPSYHALQEYLSTSKALNLNIERYEMISGAGEGSFAQLNGLLHYLGGRGLPDSSRFAQDPYYRKLLLDATWQGLRIPPNYDAATASVTRDLIDGFYRSWFDANPLIAETQALAGDDGLGVLRALPSPPSNDQIRFFVSREKALDGQLNSGSFDWIAEDFSRERYPALSADLSGLQFADREFTDQLAEKGVEHLDALRSALRTTPQVLETQDGKLRVAGKVRIVASVLDALQGYELMASESGGSAGGNCHLIPRGTLWNQADLMKAVQMDATRIKIESELLGSLPSPYHEQVLALVRSRTSNAIFQTLRNAVLPVPRAASGEASLEAELQNFSGSADQLRQVGEELAALHATSELSCLNRSLARQANDMLARVNLQLPGLYSPSGTADAIHDGQPVSLALYKVSTTDELETFLGTERQRIETLAVQAMPVVQWLTSAGDRSDVLARWRLISQDVAALQAKKPGNAIQTLESFIADDLDKVTPASNCRTSYFRTSSDLFLAVRTQLAQVAVNSCRRIAIERYNSIAADFNRRLAGHFPFSAALDLRAGAEASSAEIAAFYQNYDRQSPGLLAVLPSIDANAGAAVSFLTAVEMARPLASGTTALPDPALGVAVQFRTNRSHEILGDRIAGWSLRIGQRVIDYPTGVGNTSPVPWSLGDPVRLTLRYANNALELPAETNSSPAAEVRDRSVTYSYVDAWSILSFLRDHQPNGADPHNQSLFRIANRLVAASDTTHPPDTAVYLQLDLLPAGAKAGAAPLPVPVFPASAPVLAGKNPSGDE